MNRLEERNQKFLTFWKKWRHRKWTYVSLTGLIGLVIVVPGYFWGIDFTLANINVLKLATHTLLSAAVGVWYGLWSFKQQEKMYKKLSAANDLNKG